MAYLIKTITEFEFRIQVMHITKMCLNDLRKKNPVTNVKTSGGDIRTKKHQIKGTFNI